MTTIRNIKIAFASLSMLAIGLLAQSCQEVNPPIDFGKHNVLVDTTYVESPVQTAETKNELIELFTGVSCINCPGAHVTLDGLSSANPNRVIGVAMHSTAEPAAQDDPPPGYRQLLGSDDAQTIITQFGDPGARPVGSVDRISHTGTFGNPSIYDIAANWRGYTTARLALTTPVNIVLTKTYDPSSKTVAIATELHYTAPQTDSNKLTIFLVEDSIVTSQLQADNSNDVNYVHNDVLRIAVTNALGDKINANLIAGTVVRKILTYTITNSAWRPEHMRIIAFVHKYQNGSNEVLQVKSIPLQ